MLDAAEFHAQQSMVMGRMARHEARYGQNLDTTAVLHILNTLIPRTTVGTVESNALTDAFMAIEADIDRHMKESAQ